MCYLEDISNEVEDFVFFCIQNQYSLNLRCVVRIWHRVLFVLEQAVSVRALQEMGEYNFSRTGKMHRKD